MDNAKAIKILRKGYPDIKRYATIELGAYEYDVEAYNEALNLAIKALEERPQGKWINNCYMEGNFYHTCNQCNMEMVETVFDYFCPNCGADLRKGGAE